MTTAFTDVRVKRFLEMRGADAGRPAMMVAQSALWTGLLYDDAALAAADALVRRQPWAELCGPAGGGAAAGAGCAVRGRARRGTWRGTWWRSPIGRAAGPGAAWMRQGPTSGDSWTPLLPLVAGAADAGGGYWLTRFAVDRVVGRRVTNFCGVCGVIARMAFTDHSLCALLRAKVWALR